jgi:hypothetical protein
MDIDLPSDDNSSKDDSVFGGRIDLYESYWLYVDGVRCIGPVLRNSAASKEDTDRSPLARHYIHFYEKKEEHKEKCRDLPGNLPKYKEHFEEPRGDVRKVPRENLEDLGIDWEEEDDPIWLPPEYELPSVWESDLESMDEAELRDLVRTLRSEKTELQNERDELEERLAEIGTSISNYLTARDTPGSQQNSSPRTCEKCGETFDSKAAKHGHSSHCEGVSDSSQSESSTRELKQIAEDLPELSERQSEANHENRSPEEELENLNHLLQGSL